MSQSEHPDHSSKDVGPGVFRRLRANRRQLPVSFYLLIAMIMVLILGAQIVLVRDDPRRFAFYLALMFIFFFVVLFRAVVDLVEMARKNFREKENLFRDTLGDADFVSELGKRVEEGEQSDAAKGDEERREP